MKLKTWDQFFKELKDGKKMSAYDYKIVKTYLNDPLIHSPSSTQSSILKYIQGYAKKVYTDKELSTMLKKNPELLELFI